MKDAIYKEYYEGDHEKRFLLGTKGKKSLLVIGLNPSIADREVNDLTIRKVSTIAKINNFDSFIMLNLYGQRTPYPQKLHDILDMDIHEENIENIRNIFQTIGKVSGCSVLAAWGETISARSYFPYCLKVIYELAKPSCPNWLRLGELTKSGHPRHPSRASYSWKLTEFNILSYINKFRSRL
ncbi:MAG TPA: DUF1643 domain-containing protein [Flavipsychrobacter sp.]|nr:DUF1643 domain-containing protein [Flavipsychrobacter sp.]